MKYSLQLANFLTPLEKSQNAVYVREGFLWFLLFPCPLFSLAVTASLSLDSYRGGLVVIPGVAGGALCTSFGEQLDVRHFSELLSLMKFQN